MTLLDTHVLIWLTEGSDRLGAEARQLADVALAEEQLAVSAISFWEVSMLHGKGRIGLRQPPEAWRAELLGWGLLEVPIDGGIGISAAGLPGLHQDPADRIIVATASLAGATLVTADRRLLDWPGPLRTCDASI